MKLLTSKQIIQQRVKSDANTNRIQFTIVDRTRAFIPEQYTQLFFSDVYSELTNSQKLRYNQLFAARTNEQFMMFESGFTKHVMDNMLRLKMLSHEDDLKQCLNILLREEEKHYQMFRSLNQVCLPELYTDKPYQFLKLRWFERALLSVVCYYPQYLISLLWLVLLMEEHAVRFSKDLIKLNQTDNLGPLEPNFVLAHQAHLKDEMGHVHIDANLIDFVLDRSSRKKKQLNVILLKKLLQATLRPRHAGVNVVHQLVKECPELKIDSDRLIQAVSNFKYDPCLFPMFENPEQIPVTTSLFELYPEFEDSLSI